jgi:hypothetical protein
MNGLMALTLFIALRRENARRDEQYGAPLAEDEVLQLESDESKRRWGLQGMTRDEIVELGDKHPGYRYML